MVKKKGISYKSSLLNGLKRPGAVVTRTNNMFGVLGVVDVGEDDNSTQKESKENMQVGVGVASVSSVMNYSKSLIKFAGKLHGHESSLLLDSGASCNFISDRFVKDHGIRVSPLEKGTRSKVVVADNQDDDVVLADGSRQKILGVAKDVRSCFDGFNGIVDFVVLPLHGCDAILGMPWLEGENPVVDWKNRRILKSKLNVVEVTESDVVEPQKDVVVVVGDDENDVVDTEAVVAEKKPSLLLESEDSLLLNSRLKSNLKLKAELKPKKSSLFVEYDLC